MAKYLLRITFIIILANISQLQAQIPCISGFVYDSDGLPVIDADLDFDNAFTGERIYTPGDNTDEFGFYRVCVLPGTYHISYAPPPSTHLLGQIHYNVQLTLGDDIELNVTLQSGAVISGVIRGTDDSFIGGVDIDADDIASGRRIYTPNDNSDSITGEYWIVVPSGDYRLRFQSPYGTRWRGLQLDTIPVYSDTVINIILEEGLLLTGNVTNSAARGLENISLDLRTVDIGEKIYVANNKTDSTGYHNMAVPEGMFQLRYEPVFGSRYVGVAIDSFVINSDTERDQVLEEGVLLYATVEDSLGNRVADADLDFIDINTLDKIFTPYDKTDSAGTTIISLREGGYTIRVDPPPGSFYDRLQLDSVFISTDTAFTFILSESPRVSVTGRIVNSLGDGLENIEIELTNTQTRLKPYIADNLTDSNGYYDLFAPTGNFEAQFSPPRGSRYVGLVLKDITISNDTVWSDVVLDTGVVFISNVYNKEGRPLSNVDFDFFSTTLGVDIITPFDDTDSSGFAQMTVPPDIYTIKLSPADNMEYQELIISNFEVISDTSTIFFLDKANFISPNKFMLNENYPNPFNQLTRISYVLFEGSEVAIDIYNSLGQRVFSINKVYQSPGFYYVIWEGRDRSGDPVASGLYFYRLTTQFGDKTKEMVLIK